MTEVLNCYQDLKYHYRPCRTSDCPQLARKYFKMIYTISGVPNLPLLLMSPTKSGKDINILSVGECPMYAQANSRILHDAVIHNVCTSNVLQNF